MTEAPLRRGVETSLKRQDHQLWRQAIVSVRQSHPQQVVDHVESTAWP